MTELSKILSINPEDLKIFSAVVFAMILGALIGLERELADKPAGLRTHMLVSGASCFFSMLGFALMFYFKPEVSQGMIRSNPIDLIGAVITGVSFLGAGTIIRGSSDRVQGLTTAASLLFAAAIGVCVSLSKFHLAVLLTITVIIALRFFRPFEKKKHVIIEKKV